MSRLCLSAYHTELRKSLNGGPRGKHAMTLALFGFIIDGLDESKQIAPARTTELLKNEANAPSWAIEALNSSAITTSAAKYYEDHIVQHIAVNLEDDLVANIVELIRSDDSISTHKRTQLLELASTEHLAEFLAEVFIYVVHRPNVFDDNKETVADVLEDVVFQDIDVLRRAKEKHEALPKPLKEGIPRNPTPNELVYTQALLDAYGDAEGCVISKDILNGYKKYEDHFSRSRKEYYAAESVRRGVRDIIGEEDEGSFKSLKEEVYDSVIDVHNLEYANGYTRALHVMKHITSVGLDNCFLVDLDGWIGSNEKKGVCHELVNDRRLRWVSDE